jgi:hypothetical protein
VWGGAHVSKTLVVVALGISDLVDGIARDIEGIGDFVEAVATGSGGLFLQFVNFYREVVEVARDFIKFSVDHVVSLVLSAADDITSRPLLEFTSTR